MQIYGASKCCAALMWDCLWFESDSTIILHCAYPFMVCDVTLLLLLLLQT
jgi:hypothetical protein